MTAEKINMMGLFENEADAVSAIADMQALGWEIERVHSPVPSEKIVAALGLRKSRVGWFTLAGGIVGFFTGFLLAAFTATRWSLIVSGKPIVALVPFFIVGFEFTILFAVFGNVIGLITQAGLPRFNYNAHYDPECSGDKFGILAACGPEEAGELHAFFTERGARINTFEEAQDVAAPQEGSYA
jgi:molybdopterin-containing oxidoreductase family membrane subunit